MYADDGNINRWQESLTFLETVLPELLTLTIKDAKRLPPSTKVQEFARPNEYAQIQRANKRWQILPKRINLSFEQSEQRFKWCATILFLTSSFALLAAFSKYLINSLFFNKNFHDTTLFVVEMITTLILLFK